MILLNKNNYKLLFDDYYEVLCNFAYGYMNDYDLSEDVVQEVFVYLWQKRKKLEIKSSIKSYLYSSVKNKCIEIIRRNKLEQKYIGEKLEEAKNNEENEEEEIDNLVRIKKLYDSIEELPKKCKLIFKMAKMEGMTYNEISSELDLSVKTIESQMRRAFILLREKLI